MAMLITPRAIAKIDKMAILAIKATIVMDNENFSMAIRGIQLKSMKKIVKLCYIYINWTFCSDVFIIFVIFTALFTVL